MAIRKRILAYVLSRLDASNKQPESDVEISKGASGDITFDTDTTRVPLKLLEYYAYHDPVVFTGVNLKAASIWGKGLDVLSDNKEAEGLCRNVINIPNFKEYIINSSAQTCIYGDSYLENIWDDVKDDKGKVTEEGKNIVGFGVTDPKTLTPEWDAKGYITKYVQKVQGTKKAEFTPRKFSHFKFFSVADNVRGIGYIEPLSETIKTMLIAREATQTLIYRHGSPFAHLTKKGASVKDIPKMAKVARMINLKKSFASSEKYDWKFHSPSKGIDLQPHIDLLENTYSGGLGIIKPVLFRAGEKINRAALDKLNEFHIFDIQVHQEKVGTIIENQMFKPMMEAHGIPDIPQVVWEPLTEREEAEVIKNDLAFMKLYDEAKKMGYVTEEEVNKLIRGRLGITEGE